MVDLGEVRGFNYYTGPMFQVLAHGPGEPIASGGRYDTLLPRFGLPDTQAAGFAVDINNLCWALDTEGVPEGGFPRVVSTPEVPPEFRAELRRLGVVVCASSDVEEYAREYDFGFVLTPNSVRRLDDSMRLELTSTGVQAAAAVAQFCQGKG